MAAFCFFFSLFCRWLHHDCQLCFCCSIRIFFSLCIRLLHFCLLFCVWLPSFFLSFLMCGSIICSLFVVRGCLMFSQCGSIIRSLFVLCVAASCFQHAAASFVLCLICAWLPHVFMCLFCASLLHVCLYVCVCAWRPLFVFVCVWPPDVLYVLLIAFSACVCLLSLLRFLCVCVCGCIKFVIPFMFVMLCFLCFVLAFCVCSCFLFVAQCFLSLFFCVWLPRVFVVFQCVCIICIVAASTHRT